MGSNVQIIGDAVGKCHPHECLLMRFQHIQGHADKKLFQVLVHNQTGVKLIHGSLEGRLTTNPFEEVGLLLLLLLLVFLAGLGLGGSLLKDGTEGRYDGDGFVDELLFDAHAVEGCDEMPGNAIKVHLTQPHKKELLVFFEHELANIERIWDLGECDGHELSLVMLELVHITASKERCKVGVGHKFVVEDIDGCLKGGLSTKTLQQRAGFLFLFLLGTVLGLGGALLKDGSEGQHNIGRLLDLVGGHTQLLQRGDEMAGDQIEVRLVETLEEQTPVLVVHEVFDVDRLGDGREGHSQELALVFLQSLNRRRLEEFRELVIGNDLAVENIDGGCWCGDGAGIFIRKLVLCVAEKEGEDETCSNSEK
mmetsp:Transcript_238/g.635  ORF Transcript_238/g.635 Transcript_238/m.635 type:complete len:365 (+) Transcript_238:1906-3000(+)